MESLFVGHDFFCALIQDTLSLFGVYYGGYYDQLEPATDGWRFEGRMAHGKG